MCNFGNLPAWCSVPGSQQTWTAEGWTWKMYWGTFCLIRHYCKYECHMNQIVSDQNKNCSSSFTPIMTLHIRHVTLSTYTGFCIGSVQQVKIKLQALRVGDCLVRVTHSVRNLGVQVEAEMPMESHVTAVCRSTIFHLRNISRIRRYLTAAATEQVIRACVTSRLDVGNALLYRLSLKYIQRKIQNWVARLIGGAMKYNHATPLLMKMHWLPIALRVDFKMLLLTHEYTEPFIESKHTPAGYAGSPQWIQFTACATRKASLGWQSFPRGSPKSTECAITAWH